MTSFTPTRQAALKALDKAGASVPFPILLDELCQEKHLSPKDSGLLHELVYGFLRRQGRVAALLNPFVRNPDGLPSKLLRLLQVATHELLFLDGIPPHATVSQYVEGAREVFGPGMGGLTNGVLRSVQRQREELLEQDRLFLTQPPLQNPQDQVLALCRLGSLPDWLAQMWIAQYGFATAWDFALHASYMPGPAWRFNMSRQDWQQERAKLLASAPKAQSLEPCAIYFPWGVREVSEDLSAPQVSAQLFTLEKQGSISRQGLGAQMLLHRLATVQPWQGKIWDACCGRGGKSAAMLEMGWNVAWAGDIQEKKLEVLDRELSRLQLPIPQHIVGSAQNPPADLQADHILLDVPCSGLGTLGRNPEIRHRVKLQSLHQIQQLQADLLAGSWKALKSGGTLAYVTCSLNKHENENQITKFLTQYGATLLTQELIIPPQGHDFLFFALMKKG